MSLPGRVFTKGTASSYGNQAGVTAILTASHDFILDTILQSDLTPLTRIVARGMPLFVSPGKLTVPCT